MRSPRGCSRPSSTSRVATGCRCACGRVVNARRTTGSASRCSRAASSVTGNRLCSGVPSGW
ncbi:hypothetical protein ACFQZ4_03615 [Catellatospora coxensis]